MQTKMRVMSSIRSNKIRNYNKLSLEKAEINITRVFELGNGGGVKIKAAALFMNRRVTNRRNFRSSFNGQQQNSMIDAKEKFGDKAAPYMNNGQGSALNTYNTNGSLPLSASYKTRAENVYSNNLGSKTQTNFASMVSK